MQSNLGTFPSTRLRRLRQHGWLREMVAETQLAPNDLIWPVFVQEGKNTATPIGSMPGVFRLTLDVVVTQAKEVALLGIPAIALFPVIDSKLKSPMGDEALFEDNLICRAIREIKNAVPELGIITDVALDPYTSHGQDGIVENGQILNDQTVEILCKQAINQAKAGCDIVAPSDMMDGRVGAIRAALEDEGLHHTAILSYAAKYASSLYAPFREAVDSAKHLGAADKKTYQMDYRNSDEALREVALDIQEGADMVMVKPAGAYLDIIYRVSSNFPIPVLAYQVSGEYAMMKAATEKGWVDGHAVMLESLLAIKRAGARAILTYAALDVAKQLQS